jgi:hypothetical protein
VGCACPAKINESFWAHFGSLHIGREKKKELAMLEKLLPKNVHVLDRAIRVVLGLGLLALVFVGPQTLWGLAGLILVATAFMGSCPIYTALGLNTCNLSGPKKQMT